MTCHHAAAKGGGTHQDCWTSGVCPSLGSGCSRGNARPRAHGLEGRGSAEAGKGDQGGVAQGKVSAVQGQQGGAHIPLPSVSGSSSLSLPARVSAAWSCSCQEPPPPCPQPNSLSVLTNPIPPAVCSPLPANTSQGQGTAQGPLCLCRG